MQQKYRKDIVSVNQKGYLQFTWNKLALWYEFGDTVPGTHRYYQFLVSIHEISYERVGDEKEFAGIFTFTKATN